jgi:threonine/homoserine/homoserine lactone efflux protein
MSESLITISIAGLIAGFVFSMPIAGPISILVISNALKGKLKYCNLLTIGAALADLVYVFIAVYGLTRFYSWYKPAIPYLMGACSLFIIFIGYTIFRTKINPEHLDDKIHLPERINKEARGGFVTGLLVNLINPTLFFGWFTTSFVTISVISSLGFNTGGLHSMIDQNISEINNIRGKVIEKPNLPKYLTFDTLQIFRKEIPALNSNIPPTKNFHIIISLCFATSLAFGSIIWFYLLALFIFRGRNKISIKILNLAINSLGLLLCLFGMFIVYKTINMFL